MFDIDVQRKIIHSSIPETCHNREVCITELSNPIQSCCRLFMSKPTTIEYFIVSVDVLLIII